MNRYTIVCSSKDEDENWLRGYSFFFLFLERGKEGFNVLRERATAEMERYILINANSTNIERRSASN